MTWQKHKWKIIVPVLIVLVLAAAFTFGDRDMPKQKDTSEQPTVAAPVETPEQDTAAADVPDDVETGPVETPAESTPEPSGDPQTGESAQANTEQPEYVSPEEIQASATGEYEEVGGMLIDTGTGKDKYQTDPVPEGKPIPVEPEDVEIGDAEYTCTLSISCATILDNMDLCKKEKRELVPEDGWILKPMTVTFYEGESVLTSYSAPASNRRSTWNLRTRRSTIPPISKESIISMSLTLVTLPVGCTRSTAGSPITDAAAISSRMAM